jgi:secondary thiamine-phosphate synthase enzyme
MRWSEAGLIPVKVQTTHKREVIDLTDAVADMVPADSGVMHVFVQHTTAAVATADLDPGTDLDLLDALDGLLPDLNWRHPHDPSHTPDHLLASIIGPDVTVPYINGRLQLGTWQRIILVELDGPRERTLCVTCISLTQDTAV